VEPSIQAHRLGVTTRWLTRGSSSFRPTEACRAVSRPAMRSTLTGLREETRSPTGMGVEGTGSSARTGVSRDPFSTVHHACGAAWVIRFGRRTQRTSGLWPRFSTETSVMSALAVAVPTDMTRSTSQTRTEATTPVTSHAYNEAASICPLMAEHSSKWANRGVLRNRANGRNNHRLTRLALAHRVRRPDRARRRPIAYATD
jgi:hypothetical protein